MNTNENVSGENPREVSGHIGQEVRDKVSELGVRYEFLATREWVWKGAFIALVTGISIGVTIVGILIKILK